MKRQLILDLEDDQYVVKENGETVFSINAKSLRFVSLDFYNGVYKGRSAAIELTNVISSDKYKKGTYIFNMLSDLFISIQDELNDPEPEDITTTKPDPKRVWLYELAACAGDGFFNNESIRTDYELDSPFRDADYAVRISGNSMEPTIQDQSIVFVKATTELKDGDIGIFVVNNDVMCKRYRENGQEKWLEPENQSEYSDIHFNEDTSCITQGIVLLP